MTTLPNLWLHQAADYLLGQTSPTAGSGDESTLEFLSELGYLEPGTATDSGAVVNRHRALLLRAAAQMQRLFILPMPYSPNLVMMGAEASPSVIAGRYSASPSGSISGSGNTLGAAFEACVGEGVEFLSQFEQDGDLAVPTHGADLIDPFPSNGTPTRLDAGGDFVQARHLSTGDIVYLPAGRCLRRLAGDAAPRFALGTGCGAGVAIEDAALHGLLELVERDAAALWWRGGRTGRPVPTDGDGVADALNYLADLRGPASRRMSWYLDITTDLDIPSVAAISVDPDGRRVACGTSCRTSMAAALVAATREMCQMELAYDVVAAKRRERGEAGLNEIDRRHLQRATAIDAETCGLLHPRGRPVMHAPIGSCAQSGAALLSAIVRHLGQRDVEVMMIDLTRAQFGIPVARMVAPKLQLDPCDVESGRLTDCKRIMRHSENNVPLL